ncbi:OmpA family protein [Limimaricola hongkongensis]|uniref:Outer membrane protein, OmpA/MotB family protein n=1 Tax=Limimaricola hongkongensis DSM 17492 TaxID=1122180 RepID=A0A017HEY8_9RHOB|nr:OmpA family protein [Limimaricola hongkongensis]EYD72364.1 Outer membrane protein, OmpA/MotB family protein [Limimaricola hongkongensis DSM 17492]
MKRSYRTTTALAAGLSLMLPHLAPIAAAQQSGGALYCLDGDTPPCDDEAVTQGVPLADLKPKVLQRLAESGEIDAEAAAQAGLDFELLTSGDRKAIRQSLRALRGDADDAVSDLTDAVEDAAEAATSEVRAGADEAQAATEAAEAEAAAAAEAQAAAEAEQKAAAKAEEKAAKKAARKAEKQAEVEAQAAEEAAREAELQAEADAQAQAEADAAAQAEQQAVEQAEAEAQAEADAQAEAEAEAQAAAKAEQKAADKAARKAEKQAEVEAQAAAAAEAEQQAAETAEADSDAEATDETAAGKLTKEERAERRAKREARRAERRAERDDVDPTADEPQTSVAAAASDESAAAEVTETEIDEENSRQSDEEFEAEVGAEANAEAEAQQEARKDKDDGLSDFQKALMLGIGAVAVGSLLNNGREVVANTGDRVVVEGDDGLEIYRDDDALLRQPGAEIRTESFDDGSSRTTLTREDGTKVVTIRDAQGRVLRRSRVFADGTEIELFDDLAQSEPVDVRSLREAEPAPVTLTTAEADRAALIEALRAEAAVDTGRNYSLRQVREIEAVRALVPAIDLDTLTFATGSAALRPEQAATLVDLGLAIEDRLAENPREVFLIEGHTDAVGNDAYNLALSDRRAETVALALTETFDIPPENLVVQGYGERFLKIEDEGDVQANRRATVRRITPLLQQVASAQ